MNAIREIIEVKNNQVIIDLPQSFRKTKVEVIIFPLDADGDTTEEKHLLHKKKNIHYEQYFGITDIGAKTMEKQLNTIRAEWERHVFS